MRGIDWLTKRATNSTGPLSITDWNRMFRPGAQFTFNGQAHQAFTASNNNGALYSSNAVVFACASTRNLVFSEARFLYQRFVSSRPADLWGDATLRILEEPWPGASTGDLLTQVDLDIAQYGNSYWVRDDSGFLRLDPTYVKIVTVGAYDTEITGYQIGERLAAYLYVKDKNRPVMFLPDQIGHYKPHPDECNRFLGMSWLNPCLPDINSDLAITNHKQTTLGKGANLRYAVTMDPDLSEEEFDFFANYFRENYEGPANAGKTLILGGGSDIKTVGQTFENLSMKAITDSGEARVAAASGVPPVIVGLIPGLDSSTYSNYGQARRRFADGTLRPLWRSFSSAFSSIVNVPGDSRLWYDDRDIPFLREDVGDQAQIGMAEATTIQTLVNSGYTPESVAKYVATYDPGVLVHTGRVSVQLQEPGQPPPIKVSSTEKKTPALPAA